MSFKCIVCSDGVFRLYNDCSNPHVSIPLEFLQKTEGPKDNFAFWCKWWDNEIIFENGLTFGCLLKALEPWKDFWGTYIGINLDAYIKESKKPILLKEDNISWITFSHYVEMSHKLNYEHEKKDYTNLKKLFNNRIDPIIEPAWDIDVIPTLSGYKENEEEHFGVDHIPVNELYSVPIYLNPEKIIVFHDYIYHHRDNKKINPLNTGKKSIINNNGYGFKKTKHGLGFTIGTTFFNVKDTIRNIFTWFSYDPSLRDAQNKEISARIKESLLFIDNDENHQHLDNVIPLNIKDKNNNKESQNENKSDLEDNVIDIKEVKIMPGAFDGLIEQLNTEKNYWESTINNAKKHCTNQPLKIGEIKPGIPPKYIYGNKIED